MPEKPRVELVPVEELLPHEAVEEDAVGQLAHTIASEGVVRNPVVADRKSLVVLDGHHRLAALRSLGVKRIPAYLVDYSSDAVEVGGWRPGIPPYAKDAIVERGRKGELLPPKTTRHRFPWKLGDERVPLRDLL